MTQSQLPELIDARKTVNEAGEQDIFSVAFSPDGTKLACGGTTLVHLWTLAGDTIASERNTQSTSRHDSPLILRQHTGWIFSLAFSPDGATLASGSVDCTICLWNVDKATLRAVLHGHTETVYKVIFSPDGTWLLSCSADGTIRFWDIQTGKCINTLRIDGPYAGMNITGTIGMTDAQKSALQALGAVNERL